MRWWRGEPPPSATATQPGLAAGTVPGTTTVVLPGAPPIVLTESEKIAVAQVLEILRLADAVHGEAVLAADPEDVAYGLRGEDRVVPSSISAALHDVPVDVLGITYSDAFLDELDRLGIPHRTRADFATTYLR